MSQSFIALRRKDNRKVAVFVLLKGGSQCCLLVLLATFALAHINFCREAWHLGSFEGQGKRPHFLVVDAGRLFSIIALRSSTDSFTPSSMVANECVALHDRIDSER